MFKQFILICTLTFTTLFTSSLSASLPQTLNSRLEKASRGDFFIFSQGKNITLLTIRKKTHHFLILEEVTTPASNKQIKEKEWQKWIDNGAPHHTSWQLFSLNLQTKRIEKIYSISERSWLKITEGENFLETLLTLKLKPTPKHKRKKIGAAPLPGSVDRRADWSPPLIYHGKKVEGVPLTSWECFWPKDRSKLSGKHLQIYLPDEEESYPSYFPYWLQIAGISGKAKIRVIDTGRELTSSAAAPAAFTLDQEESKR